MNHLIVDPGNKTGWCVIKIENQEVDVIKYGFYDIDNSSDYLADACLNLEMWVKQKIQEYNIISVAREDYFFSRSFATGSKKNVHYRAAIDRAARKANLHYEIINISLWKRFICGRTTPTKEQIVWYSKRDAKKHMVQESLWDNYQIKFPNFNISQKGKRKIKFRHDIVDAVAMAIYYACIIKKCKDVKCSVVCEKDIDWGNKKLNVFNYANIKQKYKCNHVFASGNRKGTKCEKISYKLQCPTHFGKVLCNYIFLTGKNKDRMCSRGCKIGNRCGTHRNKI